MIFSKTVVSLVLALLVFSMFMANLLNIIATDHNFYVETNSEGYNFSKYLGAKYGEPRDSPENLIWFLQISDIHISVFRDPGRIAQFQQFCDSTIKKIKPVLVLASGDLTDAKAKDNLGSSQVKTEWVYYHNIIKESGIADHTVWLDIRGNHDNFNIKTLTSQENYFRNYSVQGAKNPKSYFHFEEKNGVNVAFIGIDACPDPGLRRPFNFIGVLNGQEQEQIRKLQALAAAEADHLVWFGHYPTSCIMSLESDSQKFDLRTFIGMIPSSQVYLCGHLHAMGGLVPNMYTKQKSGYLELELSDWKDNRMFRLAAIDHGFLSFIDHKHNKWPLVLVTNPKHARYVMPGREPLHLIADSTHVRLLAFSDVKLEAVKVSFDQITWIACTNIDGPLYVAKWTPDSYRTGMHNLYVSVVDEIGNEENIVHPFSMDGTSIHFDITSRILLMVDARVVFQAIFGTLLILNVIPLVILRLHHRIPRYRRRFGRKTIRSVWLLSKIDRLFYPIVLYAIYIPLGPWSVGELVDGYIGAIFAWGILIKGSYLPEPFTYMYGSVQLMFVQIPLILILAYSLELHLSEQNVTKVKLLLRHLPFAFLLSIQMLLAYFFWLEYGTLSFLIGPLRTWSIGLSLVLWYKTVTLPPDLITKLKKLIEPVQLQPIQPAIQHSQVTSQVNN